MSITNQPVSCADVSGLRNRESPLAFLGLNARKVSTSLVGMGTSRSRYALGAKSYCGFQRMLIVPALTRSLRFRRDRAHGDSYPLAQAIGVIDVVGALGTAHFLAVNEYPVRFDPSVVRTHDWMEALTIRSGHSFGQVDADVHPKSLSNFSYLLSYLLV